MKRAALSITISVLICASSRAQETPVHSYQKLAEAAYHQYLSNPDTAIALTQAALEGALRSKDQYTEAYCYFLFSKCYWVKANYKLSTQFGFRALKIFQETPHYEELSATRLALARTLVELGNVQKAQEFIHAALDSGIRHSNKKIQAAAYREQSYLLTELNQLDSALVYSDKGIALFEMLNDSMEVSILYGRKSRIFFQQNRFEESKRFAYRALVIDSLVGNRRAHGISYYQVAQNEGALGNTDKAIELLKKSIQINGAIGNLTWQIK